VPTHDRGAMLDVVASRDDLPAPTVDVIDVGLSDHRLLRWSAPLVRPPPVYTMTVRRPWSLYSTFTAGLLSSALCRPDDWSELDVDSLARLYDTEITTLLDQLVPSRAVTCRRRPSDPWFDRECRAAKCLTRRLERASRQTDPGDVVAATAAKAAWTMHRRAYIALCRHKRDTFWQNKIDAEGHDPRQLWRSRWCTTAALLGRGRAPPCDTIGAVECHQFFDAKVDGVGTLTLTADASPPSFTPAPPGCSMFNFRSLTVDNIRHCRPSTSRQTIGE